MSKCVAALLLVFLTGCSAGEPAPMPPRASGASAVAPAEMRRILEGLRSQNPRIQYSALETLRRFPSVARSQRGRIEQLQASATARKVREKAGQLLEEIPPPAEGE